MSIIKAKESWNREWLVADGRRGLEREEEEIEKALVCACKCA